MKKVAVVIDEMSIGGIPKACVDFVNQLKDYCEVVLLMKRADGPLMKGLTSEISVKILKTPGFSDVVQTLKKTKQYISLIEYVALFFYWTRIKKRWVKANQLTAKTYGAFDDDGYDCVISYHGMNISQLLLSIYGVNARKKIAWIHGDHPFEGIHKKDIGAVYDKFDKIFCVSDSVCTRFLGDFPFLKGKVDSYKNLLLPERIKKLSEESITDNLECNTIKIVTVGRLSKEKGQEMIPHVVKNLCERGLKIHWYIVGDGGDKERLKRISCELQVEDYISFLGAKSNPYPYMKMCDVYVQPSYTEGYCLTVCEASILRKPIVLTKIAATGILEDGITGVVVDANVDSITHGIERMIADSNLREKIESNLASLDLSNSREIDKLIQFLN